MGRGGMASKVTAAQYAADNGAVVHRGCELVAGVPCVIANGFDWRSILDIIEGRPLGTLFAPKPH